MQPILSLPEVKVYVSKNLEDHFLLSRSSCITFPIYPYIPFEIPGSSPHFPPHLYFSSLSRDLSPYDFLAKLCSHLPKAIKGLVHQSFEIFDNLQYSPQISSPRVSMAGVGGAEGGGASGHVNVPITSPRIFTKVAARYAPLALLVVLHDLPDNYMKKLPKFTSEGDLTTTEHIVFFDQFDDILGIKHEDLYMILLVQNFEGHVRTWFKGLHVDSIPSYNDLKTYFLRQ